MQYRIYPPIGIARLGNSLGFFVGPEMRDSAGVEIDANGSETEVVDYKDSAHRMKRQAARFHLFQFADASAVGAPAELPTGTTVTWTVRLVNKKDAVVRPGDPPPPPAPGELFRPKLVAGRENRVIDSDAQAVAGANAPAKILAGTYLKGTVMATEVVLGELRTDARQRLLVLGGMGKSGSPESSPIGQEPNGGGYYANTGWYDDIGDGPVSAVITLPDGTRQEAVPAWVVVAPPDFAPAVRGVVTLYDDLVQLALPELQLSAVPTFYRDIQPILERASALRNVNASPIWSAIETDWVSLSDPAKSTSSQRGQNVDRVLKIEQRFSHEDQPYSTYRLNAWQKNYLEQWVAGKFVTGWPPPGSKTHLTPQSLTRTVLDGTIGQTFFPGIEAGVIMLDRSVYSEPFDFRLDGTKIGAGDITAMMALPWQADFFDCSTDWWPSQRPNAVVPQSGQNGNWMRGILSERQMTQDVMRLGVVTEVAMSGGGVMIREDGRDPALPG